MNIAYNMDCMEAMREMPDKCFDLAEVDPPYYENARSIRRLDMTIEEAIKVIDPDYRGNEAAEILNRFDDLSEGVREAHRTVIAALRAHEAPPPNDPLTLEQLKEMDGEPVWIAREDGEDRWALIRYCNFYGIGTYGCGFLVFDTYSINWLAYPEEIPYERLD